MLPRENILQWLAMVISWAAYFYVFIFCPLRERSGSSVSCNNKRQRATEEGHSKLVTFYCERWCSFFVTALPAVTFRPPQSSSDDLTGEAHTQTQAHTFTCPFVTSVRFLNKQFIEKGLPLSRKTVCMWSPHIFACRTFLTYRGG